MMQRAATEADNWLEGGVFGLDAKSWENRNIKFAVRVLHFYTRCCRIYLNKYIGNYFPGGQSCPSAWDLQ